MKNFFDYPEVVAFYGSTIAAEYLSSRSTVFALALHNAHRFRIELLLKSDDKGGSKSSEPLAAWCIRKDGTLVNVLGTVTRTQLLAEYGGSGVDIKPATRSDLLDLFSNRPYSIAPRPRELFMLQRYICLNREVYKFGIRAVLPISEMSTTEQIRLISALPDEVQEKMLQRLSAQETPVLSRFLM